MAISRIGSAPNFSLRTPLYAPNVIGGGFFRPTPLMAACDKGAVGGASRSNIRFEGISINPDKLVISTALAVTTPKSIDEFPMIDVKATAAARGITVDELIKEKTRRLNQAFDRVIAEIDDKLVGKDMILALLMDARTQSLGHMNNPEDPACASEAIKRLYNMMEITLKGTAYGDRLFQDCVPLLLSVLAKLYGGFDDISSVVDNATYKGIVLFADQIPYTSAGVLHSKKVLGSVRRKGSPGDHISIETLNSDKAGVVQAQWLDDAVSTGDTVILDGRRGIVIVNPDKKTLAKYQLAIEQDQKISRRIRPLRKTPKRGISILFNADTPHEAELALKYGAQGIGLVRTERFYASDMDNNPRNCAPEKDDELTFYDEIFSRSGGKCVIRTIDPSGDKQFPYIQLAQDGAANFQDFEKCLDPSNPYSLLFRRQTEALLKSHVRQVMFPMINSKAQYERALGVVEDVTAMLARCGEQYNPNMSFGVMVEHPGVLKDVEAIAKWYEDSFFSIGSNDLSSLLTGTDRYGGVSASAFRSNQFNPIVLAAMKGVIDTANEYGREVSLCGNMSSDWRGVLLLHAMGLKKMSFANAHTADIGRFIMFNVQRKSAVPLLQMALQTTSPQQVISTVDQFTSDMIRRGEWEALQTIEPIIFAPPL